MLLGIGTARTDAEIAAEHASCYHQHCTARQLKVGVIRLRAPRRMPRSIGKPILEWTEADVDAVFRRCTRGSNTLQSYATFVAFLLLRGYFRPSLPFLLQAPVDVSRAFAGVLAPLRARIMTALAAAERPVSPHDAIGGYEINLLLYLTIYIGGPLEAVTRAQFDDFRATYLRLRRTSRGASVPHSVTTALTHIESCLIRWGYLTPALRPPSAHERRAGAIDAPAVQQALGRYSAVCTARLRPKGATAARDYIVRFFLWTQEYLMREHGQECRGLADVTREVTVAYTTEMSARYSVHHVHDLHCQVRRFFDFAIEEQLPTAPQRNPFSSRDLPHLQEEIPRYFADADLQRILAYCEREAAVIDRVVVITLLHTGIRASECAGLRVSDLVQVQGTWKLHVHVGKGLKDRVIPLTAECARVLHAWCQANAISGDAPLFRHHGRQWGAAAVEAHCRTLGRILGIAQANPHRFRHTFAVALLNYGIRETALQKLLGHTSLSMTLEYAKILDHTVEQAFSEAVTQMREGPLSWVPSFFTQEDYTLFAQGDTLNWIRLPVGFCRRNPQLHCESDVKCFLCERFYLTPESLPLLRDMHERFVALELPLKAVVIQHWIERLERVAAGQGDLALPNGNPPTGPTGPNHPTGPIGTGTQTLIPLQNVTRSPRRQEAATAAALAPTGEAGG